MDKIELYRLLSNADKKNRHWEEAFKLYEESNTKLEGIGCRSCRTKVINWLRRG